MRPRKEGNLWHSRRDCEATGWQAFWLSGALRNMSCYARAEPLAISISCPPPLFIIDKSDAAVVNDALAELRSCLLTNLASLKASSHILWDYARVQAELQV